MKSLSRLICSLLVLTLVFSYACKKDKDPVTCNYVIELQAEFNAIGVAVTAYGNNPSMANCQAIVVAYQTYLSEAAKLQACAEAAGQGTEYHQAILDAEAQLALIQC